jgi:ATP-binding cassette subfamily F protein 3
VIQLSGVRLARGSRSLLEDATVTLHAGERVGVIGANGCGKSTLFSLLRGELQCDAGDVSLPAGWRIASMEQEVAASDRSALDFVLDGDREYRELEARMETAEGAEIGELHARFGAIDGYRAPTRAHGLLDGLGFAPAERERAVRAFSGGWRVRLALARTLMCPSELMLLDEPTNHLDIDALVWLEAWLLRYPGTLLIISHDREFLDNVATRIISFEGTRLSAWRGNYSAFELQRAERIAAQQGAYEKQQTRIAEIERFVARFKAKATKARQAQSRVKELERMARIAPAHMDSPFELRLPCSERVSTPLLTIARATLGHTGSPILSGVDIGIMPGERVGLLGANGAGKSTLIRSIAGELPLLAGERHTGEHLRVGYFAQHQLEALDPQASPLLHVQRLTRNATEQSIRDFLGGYGFHGEQTTSAVGRFSGGEQARLALALIAWLKPNLLLLDEPTNHLDLEMRHALTVALQEYAGAVLLVSHDRHLLKNTVDVFWLVRDGKVREFDGDLDDYRKLSLSMHRVEPAIEAGSAAAAPAPAREDRRSAAERREQLRPLKQRVATLEKQIEKLQKDLTALEARLSEPALYDPGRSAEVQQLLRQQASMREQMEQYEEEWLAASEELESQSG